MAQLYLISETLFFKLLIVLYCFVFLPSEIQHDGKDQQSNVKTLEETIAEMNADFGEKRAKFKHLFLQKEGYQSNKYIIKQHNSPK